MAPKNVEIHPDALAELKSAILWYAERSQPAAVRFSEAVAWPLVAAYQPTFIPLFCSSSHFFSGAK